MMEVTQVLKDIEEARAGAGWGHEDCDSCEEEKAKAAEAVLNKAFAAHAAQARQEVEAVLADPAAVHVNMLRGGIAKPSPSNIWHIYGDDLVAAMPAEMRRGVQQEVLDRLRDLPVEIEDRVFDLARVDLPEIEHKALHIVCAALADALQEQKP